ncbi:hypothetical protein C7M61_002007 [Candidozyma pseudohaemuli]|uniref:Uncharacterized protein n=1 Tax=Candidozyma pseudohaemuli TaxID=418784 RepID=A0A2P7YTU7_9ASCO|nr:hypothetical protein C7M61_002007 [[Candida] pseudohaemulonii]PSK39396.1 hypothetical protein C7M61_002007 [[Candida] pseudohaemulonii]
MKFASVATLAFLTSSTLVGAAPVDEMNSGGLVLSKREMDFFNEATVEMVVRELMNGASEDDLHKRFELSDGQKQFISKIFNLLKKYAAGFLSKKLHPTSGAGTATATGTNPVTGTATASTAPTSAGGYGGDNYGTDAAATTKDSAGAAGAVMSAIKGAY